MRGKVCSKKANCSYSGITPAYAGKRGSGHRQTHPTQDHPRLCGEKLKFIDEKILRQGSPPPMRGKVDQLFNVMRTIRITPAYAGKRIISHTPVQDRRDHPRLCGEKAVVFFRCRYQKGSPPPMRGKV